MANSPSIGSTQIKVSHVLTNETELQNIEIKNGRLYLCEDTGNLYYDMNNTRNRIFKDSLDEIDTKIRNFNITLTAMNETITTLRNSMTNMSYAPLEINSFSPNTPYVELGNTINSVILSWTLNRDPAAQSIDNSTINPGLREYRVSGPFTASALGSKSWTLNVSDSSGNSAQANTSITYCNAIYYGVNTSTSYNNNLISSLNKLLSNSKARTLNFSANAGEYIYYCIPSRLGRPSFSFGGFTGGFTKLDTVSFTNNYSYTENYDIWRSDNPNLGSVTIAIS